jgi:hypothetical protein
MFARKWSPALVVLLGTLALTGCSGGNEVTGLGGGGGSHVDSATPTRVPVYVTPVPDPTPRTVPTPRPCPPRFGPGCGYPG